MTRHPHRTRRLSLFPLLALNARSALAQAATPPPGPAATASPHPRRINWLILAAALWLPVGLASALRAQPAATGVIEGRVFNAVSGAALRNARITVATTPPAGTMTNDIGAYRFAGLPPGPLAVTVHYLGLAPQTTTVDVPATGSASRDFELTASATTGETVALGAFTVIADREMSAQAVALNERRSSANIKNVVALDEYGEIGDENIGEFMRFLPGVGVNDSGLTASNLTLRGFPSANTGMQLDGAEIASRNTSRSQSLLDVSLANISRVEVSKVLTPDMPASGLGGAINVVSKNGFDSKRPVFNYQAYMLFTDTVPLTFSGGPPGQVKELSPRYQWPSFNLSYLRPINRRLAFSGGLAHSYRLKPMEDGNKYSDTQSDWNLVGGFQRQGTFFSLRSLLETWSGQFGVDYKLTERDILRVSVQGRLVSNFIMRNDLIAAYGAGATGNRSFTQGAATAVGTMTQASGTNRETATATLHATLKYQHLGDTWRIDGSAAWSRNRSILDDIDDGHFDSAPTRLSGLILRGEGIGENDAVIPVRYLATKAGAPIDVYDGRNYSIISAASSQFNNITWRLNARVDATRDFRTRVPFTLKVGAFVDRQDKDNKTANQSWSFNPNGLTTDAARLAGNFDVFDAAFLAKAPKVFGRSMGWISLQKLHELYRSQPGWFVRDEAVYYQNTATNSRRFAETISAGYLRADTRLFNNRLWLVGGVRYESTADFGAGLLNDPNAQYQKDAAGNLVDGNATTAGIQPVLLTSDPLARAKLRYKSRGTQVHRRYGDFYPSLSGTFHLTETLLVRAGYARSIGRPDITTVVPGSTVSEPTVASPTITVNNTALRPWTADGYDFSLETYQIKGGSGSIGVFRKEISNFFGSVTTHATPEWLALYGLPADPVYLNYNITTLSNVGDARINGVEFSYTQKLLFLPHWARGVQVSFNSTKLSVHGSNTADFDGFAPQNLAGSISLTRPRFLIRLTCTHQGETNTGAVAVSAANGIPANTYTYQGARTRWGLNAQYNLTKHFSLYGAMTDIDGGMVTLSRRYAPDTPDYARNVRRQELGSAVTLGVKGQF